MAQTTPDVEQLVSAYVDVYGDGDYERIPEVVADSAAIHDPGAPGGVVHGHDELEAHLREIQGGFPDFTITVNDVLSGDGVVMTEWSLRATHTGEYDGVPPTGREVELRGMSKTTVADGKVQEDRIYYDFQAFLEQLGLVDGRE